MTIRLMNLNKNIVLNTDLGFANRIISKYSITGKYFFKGISLTYLNRIDPETGEQENGKDVYLALRLLLSYNSRGYYETMISSRETYLRSLNSVLVNQLNQLKFNHVSGSEYINHIYHLVSSEMTEVNRERIQKLLTENIQSLTREHQSSLSPEQLQQVKNLYDYSKREYHLPNSGSNTINNQTENGLRSITGANILRASDTGTNEGFYSISSNLINLLHRTERMFTEEVREHFIAVIRSLPINEEDKKAAAASVRYEKGTSSQCDTAAYRLTEAISREVKSEQFLFTMRKLGVNSNEIERLISYFSDRKEIRQYKEVLKEYILVSPKEVRKELTELILKGSTAGQYTDEKQAVINQIEHFSDRELVHFTEELEEKKQDIYRNILLSYKTEMELTQLTRSEQEKTVTETEAKNRGINDISIRHWITDNHELTKENLYYLYDTGPDLQNLVSGKLFFISSGAYYKKVIKEELIDMVMAGSDTENNIVLNKIRNAASHTEVLQLQDSTENEADTYREISSTNTLVHMIRSADTENLEKILRIISSDRNYGSRAAELLLREQLNDRSVGITSTKFIKEPGSGLKEYLLSSIRQIQRTLFYKRQSSFVKEKLIKVIEESSQSRINKVVQLIKDSFTEEDIVRLLRYEKKITETSESGSFSLMDIIKIIRNSEASELETFLSLLGNSHIYIGTEINQLSEKLIYKKELFDKMTDIRDITESIHDRYAMSSIRWYREKQLMKNSVSRLKEKLIHMITSGRQKENTVLYHTIKAQSPEEETIKEIENYPEPNNSPDGMTESGKLVLYIQKADSGTLDRIIQVIGSSPDYRERANELLTDIRINYRRRTEQTENRHTVFESSIALNKQLYEQKHRLPGITSRQQLIERILDSTRQEQESLIDLISRQQVSSEVKSRLITSLILKENNEIDRETVSQILSEATTQDIEEIFTAYRNYPEKKQSMTGQETAGQDRDIMPDSTFEFRLERRKETSEEAVKKAVDNYIISQRAEMNYSHSHSTVNELDVQKKELKKIKENLSLQYKTVEELKKQLAISRETAGRVDVNKLSKEILQNMKQQLMVARMRKGLD